MGSNNGAGATREGVGKLGRNIIYMRWPKNIQRGELKSTCALELVAALLAVCTDIPTLARKPVVIFVDNISSCLAWRRGYSKSDEIATTLVKALFYVCAASRITLFTAHVPRRSNPESIIADDLSKGTVDKHLLAIIGKERIAKGWRWSRVPAQLFAWLTNPVHDEGSGMRRTSERATTPPC